MIYQRHRQTDGQTTCDRKTALCTKVHRAVNIRATLQQHAVECIGYLLQVTLKSTQRPSSTCEVK